MRGARGWIIAGVLAVLLVAVVLYNQQNASSGDHSSNSDAADGTSALYQLASALGHPTDQVEGSFTLPNSSGLMFVFKPTTAYTADEAAGAAAWVRDGGLLVYASETPDEQLESALGVRRLGALVGENEVDATPVLDGVTRVTGAAFSQPFATTASQVTLLRAGGLAIGYEEHLGSGTVVALSDPLLLANGYLEKADNGRFAADLLGMVSAGAPVAFDEYHHGITASELTPQAWLLTPWGAGLLWLLVAVFFGLLLRGRRFGPLAPRRGAGPARAEAEWAVAVGELLRRAGARAVTLGVLARASERAVAARTGLSVEPREHFWLALRQRAPEAAAELESAEQALWSSTGTEHGLLDAARRLHHVAYPVAEERRRSTRQ